MVPQSLREYSCCVYPLSGVGLLGPQCPAGSATGVGASRSRGALARAPGPRLTSTPGESLLGSTGRRRLPRDPHGVSSLYLILLLHAGVGSKGGTASLPRRTSGLRPVLAELVFIVFAACVDRSGGGYSHREPVPKEREAGQEGSRHALEMPPLVALAVLGFWAKVLSLQYCWSFQDKCLILKAHTRGMISAA